MHDMTEAWLEAGVDLGVRVIAPYTVQSGHGEINVLAYLPDFGSRKGTLVFSMRDDEGVQSLSSAGFFCSQLNPEEYGCYDRDLFIATLTDWQWLSTIGKLPQWYTGEPWGENT
jgi:hypothetical protein